MTWEEQVAEVRERITRADAHINLHQRVVGSFSSDDLLAYAKHERSTAHILAVLTLGEPFEALDQVEGE